MHRANCMISFILVFLIILTGQTFACSARSDPYSVHQPDKTDCQAVPNRPPVANAGRDIVTGVSFETWLWGYGASDDSYIVKYEWDFDGDGQYDWESSEKGVTSHIYHLPGTYSAILRVIDLRGNIAVDVVKVIVERGRGEQESLIETAIRPPKVQKAVTAGDGITKRYVVMINGGSESRFWNDVTFMYSTLIDDYNFTPESIYLFNHNGSNPFGENPNNMIDYPAEKSHIDSVFSELGGIMDGDDEFFVWVTDHGRGYEGLQSQGGKFYGYLDGYASVDPGDEEDYREMDFKLRSFFTGGDYRCNHGMEVWKVEYHPDSSKMLRNKYVSHFTDVYFEDLGDARSDNDLFIERFVDYLVGDYNRNGIIETGEGEVYDSDEDGNPPYDPGIGFDEDDWGNIDHYEDDLTHISTRVPGDRYMIFDAGFDNHVDIDINYDMGNLEVDGTDLDNQGLFDGVDVNDDGDMSDWVSIDETICLHGDDLLDDELAIFLDRINVKVISIFMEPCFSGGFVEDLSAPNRVISTATIEEAVSWGDVWGDLFAANFTRAFHEATDADYNGNGFISMQEAFNYACANDYYDEIPQYDDNGDGISHTCPIPHRGDGELGANVYLLDIPRTIYVATTGDDVTGDGGETNPYRTIQKGIDATDYIVLVADGIYTGPGNVNLDFHGKAITVRSENGPANCVIDCEEAEDTRGFYFHNGEEADSVIQGFTIRNGRHDTGGGISCINSSPTIMNNIITGNSSNFGGAIYCNYSLSKIMNNVISGNSTVHRGCIFSGSSSALEILNNTITGNWGGMGGIYCNPDCAATVTNTILWNDGLDEICVDASGEVTISYSDVQDGQAGIITNDNGTVDWGGGNIDTHPLFVDAGNRDYHLSVFSPCIGAGISTGAPITDMEGRTRPDPAGSNPDMGAYENSRAEPGTITVTSPNGGEVWRGGSSQNITWNSPGPDGHYIRLLYSTDGGSTYSETIIPNADDDGVYEWNPVSSLDSATVRVKAIVEFEGVGEAASDTSDSNFMIDSTAPETSISSLTGTEGENGWYQSDVKVELSATDNLSGISQTTYRENQGDWQIYPDQGVTVTSSTVIYYRSQDNAGNLEAENSIEIKIDKTSPPQPVVTDDGIYTSSTTQLHAWWTSDDPESGIQKYEYAVGTAPGEDDVVEWTSEGIRMGGSNSADGMADGITLDGTNVIDWASVDGEVTVTDLSLIDGHTYYFSVRAKNNAGLRSVDGHSDGITVDVDLEQKELHLYPGWNLISICLDTEDTGISSVLGPIKGLYTVVWSYNAASGGWRWYVPEGDPLFNGLNTIEFGKAYCINMVEEATLTIAGEQIADTAIQLLQGWNLAGYNSTEPQPRDAALSTIADNCICVWTYNNQTGSWCRYIPGISHAFSDLVDFVPDRGYWICVDKSCEWRISP